MMDMGNAERKMIWHVDYDWVNERVRKYLGIENYEFLAAEECGDDTSYEFTALESLEHPYDKQYQPEDVREAQAGNWSWKAGSLLTELALRGHIEPGDYVVRVC